MTEYILAWKVVVICVCRFLPYLLAAIPVSIGVFRLFRVRQLI